MSDRRAALPGLLLCFALAAGCAQEGRLIDIPLPVNAVAYDQHIDTVTTDTVYFSTRIKIQVHAANPCEASHLLLELRRTGDTAFPTFVIRPIARYNADDPCTNQGTTPSDTTLTLTVTGLRDISAASIPFEVQQASGPQFAFGEDSTITALLPGTMHFQIVVEDKATTAGIAGATVALDSLSASGPMPIGTSATNGGGIATFDVPTTAGRGEPALKYRVTVTNGPDVRVIDVRVAPALGKARERMTVRI